MNQNSIETAYQAATEIARSLAILKPLHSFAAISPVAEVICEHAPRVVFRTRELARMKESEPEIFQAAEELRNDVVRCGDRHGHSYLELALQWGERTTTSFVRHKDMRSLLEAWSDCDMRGFGFLGKFGLGLGVALEKESRRLQAQIKANVAKLPEPLPFPVTVDGNQIVVDGEAFPVQPHFAEWVQMLLEARGREKVPASRFAEIPRCHGMNISHQFERLFEEVPPLRPLISSKRGKGGGWYFNC